MRTRVSKFYTIVVLAMCHVLVLQQHVVAQQDRATNFPSHQDSSNGEAVYQEIQRGNQRTVHDPDVARAAMERMQENRGEPQIPAGFPLDDANQQWVDQLLAFWEQSSDQVKAYRCDFKRWNYLPSVLAYRDPSTHKLAAHSIMVGTIRFAKPGRGRYDIDTVWHFNAPEQSGGEPRYDLNPDESARANERETWICDGTTIYEFDYMNKRLNEARLPTEMQGEGLKNSPLPFVFGAKADDLKARFWIRPMVPEGLPDGYYMIEAFPKTSIDARTYSKIQIVLSSEPFLPVRVELFSVAFDPRTNPESAVLVFENRKINEPRDLIQKAIEEVFSRPMLPRGWERFETDLSKDEGPTYGAQPTFGQPSQPSANQDLNRNIR
ncbi:MAG TPA: TIGR03009 domain-containing protein [Pirellulaceae bacterium]|nr:TIGR03009 domain-containing protein [Pirellulaceae bacterium]HMO94043.1 TIGR03009 domain-containing protein [Pirellulaceae bacterium]HMP70913.1 TIGR03009 domain-containing protein [Pirellulaceae bacterium]